MNVPESLYQKVLPALRKIEKIRKPYLFFRFLSLTSLSIVVAWTLITIIFSVITAFLDPENFITVQFDNFMRFFSPWGINLVMSVLPTIFSVSCFPLFFLSISVVKAQENFLTSILKEINTNFTFFKGAISQDKILRSGFFSKNNNKNDHQSYGMNTGIVKGTVEDIAVEFSDINVINTSASRMGCFIFIPVIGMIINLAIILWANLKNIFGKRRGVHIHGFRGLFFTADFNKKLKGFTVVLPDRYEKHFGFLTKTIQELNKNHGELVYLEDPRFEKEFVIYSTDQIEARYILTSNFMEKILELKKKLEYPLLLSFRGKKIYIMIPDPEGIFDVSLRGNVLRPSILERPYRNLTSCIEIVKELKLNRRIWGGEKSVSQE